MGEMDEMSKKGNDKHRSSLCLNKFIILFYECFFLDDLLISWRFQLYYYEPITMVNS